MVTGEVRQLVVKKRLDILLLQELYSRKLGASSTVRGLETGIRMAAVLTQYPWAVIAVSNPNFDVSFVSQHNTPYCLLADVLNPGFPVQVSFFYVQHSDDTEKHLEKGFHALRGMRLLISINVMAMSSLWDVPCSDNGGVQFEELIRGFGLQLVNDAARPPTYWTTRGSGVT